MTTTRKPPPIRRDWISKTLAGTLLGLGLALACSALFVQINPAMVASARNQLAMWMVMPLWLGVLSGCFFFGSGLRAWLWLGAANLMAFGALGVLRLL